MGDVANCKLGYFTQWNDAEHSTADNASSVPYYLQCHITRTYPRPNITKALAKLLRNLTSGCPLHDLWLQQCITLWSEALPTKFGSHRAFLSNLTSDWPCLTPAWPLPQLCITLWSVVLPTKFGIYRAFLSNVTSGWPWLTPAWPLTQQCITLWSKALSTKFGSHRAFLSNLTSDWPCLTPAWPLTPAMHYTLVRGPSYQIW